MEYKLLDSVATFMLTKIRLSHYDEQFIGNLLDYMARNNAITSNQDSLFKRVSRKYVRQFRQHNLDIDELMKLPWHGKVIPSLPEYTHASVTIQDDKIIFRAPYKKDFLSQLKKNPIYGFTWIKESRQYEVQYSLHALQRVLSLSADQYEDINYCPLTMQIVERLSEYEDAKYWNPTLVLRNGLLYIMACTDALYKATLDIPLTLELKTIAQLAQYGINVDSSVREHFYETEPMLKVDFASSYITNFEHKFVPLMMQWLKEFGCDVVGENNPFQAKNGRTLRADYITDLTLMGIRYTTTIESEELTSNNNPVLLMFRGGLSSLYAKPMKLLKIIKLVNSEPVNLGPK